MVSAELAPTLGFVWNLGKSPEGEPTREVFLEWNKPEINPGRVAYQLVREVYRWFAFEDNQVPFTSMLDDGTVEIDPKRIKDLDNPLVQRG